MVLILRVPSLSLSRLTKHSVSGLATAVLTKLLDSSRVGRVQIGERYPYPKNESTLSRRSRTTNPWEVKSPPAEMGQRFVGVDTLLCWAMATVCGLAWGVPFQLQ